MSFRRYPEYIDSGVDWLGQVPDHWEVLKLGYIAKSQGGGTPPKEELHYWNGGIPWVTPKDMKVERVVTTIDTLSEEALYSSPAKLIRPGNVLIVFRSGILRKRIPVAINDVEVTINQDLRAYDVSSLMLPEFFLRLVQGLNRELIFEWSKQGATVESLESELVNSTHIPVPPKSEQELILAFLDHETTKIDSLIREQERLIELLQEEINSLTLLPYQSGTWPEERIGNVVEVIKRPVQQEIGNEYIALGLYNRGRGLFHKEAKQSEDMGDSDFFWVESGDLIISGQFAWEGAVALTGESENGKVVSHRYPIIRGRRGGVKTEYLYALLTTSHGNYLLNENSRGAAGRNRPLNVSSLLKEKIKLPSESIQKSVAGAVHKIKGIRQEAHIQKRLLLERRSALISAVVTGKIDVRNWKPPTDESAFSENVLKAGLEAEA